MNSKVQLANDDHDTDDEGFDMYRDDWQDDLRGWGFGRPTPEGVFLLVSTVIALLFVVAVFAIEVWRVLNGS